MTVGVFYAWDFLMLIIVCLCYWWCPTRFIGKKEEYVKFFLTVFSIYFLIFLIVQNVCTETSFANWLWWTLLCPFLFIAHLIYPFKERKRNQHLCFFLFFAGLYSLGIHFMTFIGFIYSNM